jgi:hypothetical protein
MQEEGADSSVSAVTSSDGDNSDARAAASPAASSGHTSAAARTNRPRSPDSARAICSGKAVSIQAGAHQSPASSDQQHSEETANSAPGSTGSRQSPFQCGENAILAGF